MNAYVASIKSLWIVSWKGPRLIEAIATIGLRAKLAELELLERGDLVKTRVAHKGHSSALRLLHHRDFFFICGHQGLLLQLEYQIIGVE